MGFFSDIGNAVSSAAGAVGDVVEGAVEGVTEAVDDVVDTLVDGAQGGLGWASSWLCKHAGGVGCRIGNIVLGAVSGVLEGVQDIVGQALNVVADLGGAVGALLHGDIARFIGKLGDALAHAVEGVIDIVRLFTGGTIFGGIREFWQMHDLREFVDGLVNSHFASDPARLARIRDRLGLDDTSWGYDMKANHRVFRLDSETAPLWEWHRDGRLDLYAMAGIVSFGSFKVNRKRTMIRTVNKEGSIEGSFPITRWSLAKYIDSEGAEGRIHAYALTPNAVKDFIQVATEKFKRLGIHLKWNEGGRFKFFPRSAVHNISTLEEFKFDRTTFGTYLLTKELRTAGEPACDLLSLAAFEFVDGLGITKGRSIDEGKEGTPCSVTPDRDDSCCISVLESEGAGVLYHDEWPPSIFRYVLAHEGGHYVGLCHFGHDGFQNIMFTPAPEANLSAKSWGLFKYYLDDEPSFSLKDAKNVWRFLVAELADCLDPEGATQPAPDPGPVIL